MPGYILDFEKPVLDLERRVKELKEGAEGDEKLILALQKEFEEKIARIYKYLTPYETLLVARHPLRPKTDEYINSIFEDFLEIKGDRIRGEDKSTVAGIGHINGEKVAVLGTRKASGFLENLEVNFGMPSFSGFKKAERLFELAERYDLPVISFVDTPGALYGTKGEIEGTYIAISDTINKALTLKVPVLSVIIGEAESTGALPFLTSDRIYILKYSILSVISPEITALILFKDKNKAQDASFSLRLTSDEVIKFPIVNKIIDEGIGGAHRNKEYVTDKVKKEIEAFLKEFKNKNIDEIIKERNERFLSLNYFEVEELY